MMTRNIRQTANSGAVRSDLGQLRLGNLGVPTFKARATQTVQTVYRGLTPADMASFNSADQAAKNIHS
jgi:hypothetical protein